MSKNGFRRGKQCYKCHSCNRQFTIRPKFDIEQLYYEFSLGKQTYTQLAKQYDCSTRTISRYLDKFAIEPKIIHLQAVTILMDTTYWGRTFGVMVFRDAISKSNLLRYFVSHESILKYKEGITEILSTGIEINAIVCDGKPGLLNGFPSIPIQMCHFHQKQIIVRYLTKKPKLEASIELMQIIDILCFTDKDSFVGSLNSWYAKWECFINERTENPTTKRKFYTHKRLRSAYKSLKRNQEYLFTFQDYMELNIPNTTNGIDGHFSDLKTKLRNHNGLTKERKKKFIDHYLQIKNANKT